MKQKELQDGTVAVLETRNTVIERNEIMVAISQYTAAMMDIFYLCLSASCPAIGYNKYSDDYGVVKIIPENVIRTEMAKGRIVSSVFKETCQKLAGTVAELNFQDGFGFVPVFIRIRYISGEGLIFQWHPDIQDRVLQIEKNFSEVTCKYIYATGKDKWAKRIVEQIARWTYKYPHGREYEYQELRDLLGVSNTEFQGEKGKQNFLFKLKKSAAKVSKNTPYQITVTTSKKDVLHPRVVSHYFIGWNLIADREHESEEAEQQQLSYTLESIPINTNSTEVNKQCALKDISQLTKYEQDVVQRMIDKYGFDAKMAIKYTVSKGIPYCQAQMEYVRHAKKAGNAINPGGYLLKALEQDYAGQEANRRNIQKADKVHKTSNPNLATHIDNYESPKEETEHEKWLRAKLQYTVRATSKALIDGLDIIAAQREAEEEFRKKNPEPIA